MSDTNNAPAYQPIPGLDTLGFGYDVRGQYANSLELKLPIIAVGPATNQTTVNNTVYLVPDNVTLNEHSVNYSTYEQVTGTTLEQYSSSLNSTTKIAGNYQFFSGSLQVDFTKDDMKNSEYEFSTIRNTIELWSLNLPDANTLTLIDTANQDLNGKDSNGNYTMSGIDVLNKYGSHYVWQAVVGGRADYSSETDKMTFDQSYNLGVVAEMSYKNAIGSITAQEQASYGAQIQNFDASSSTVIHTQGGDPTLGSKIANGGFDEWAASVNSQPQLMDFTPNSLVPIWTLCTDPARQQELSDAFADYMAASPQDIVQNEPLINVLFTDQMIPAGTDHDSGANKDLAVFLPACSEGYYWLGQYAKGDDSPANGVAAIIQSLTPGSTALPIGYTKVWDNSGGKGKYKYSLWRPVPPVGYVALGYLMRLWNHDTNAPSGDEVAGLVCVHESLVVQSMVDSNDIWNDHGTNADHDCSIYSIIPDPSKLVPADEDGGNANQTTGVNVGTYYGQEHSTSHSPNPTSPRVFCLDRTKVTIANPNMEPKAHN